MISNESYSDVELTIFKKVKEYFETISPIASDEYENAFYDLVAQFGSGGEDYIDSESLFTDLIEVQVEIAFEQLSENDKEKIKELYEDYYFGKDYYDQDIEKYVYDTTDLSKYIASTFKSWIDDTFDQDYLYDDAIDEDEGFQYDDDDYDYDKEESSMSISKQIINRFIESELKIFKKLFEENRFIEIHENGSLSIAWVCYYFKKSITRVNTLSILEIVDDLNIKGVHNTPGWYKISGLQAAAYILTSDIFYADSLIRNIDCANNYARRFIIESAGLICSLVSFKGEYLKTLVEFNLNQRQDYYEESVIVYLSSTGIAAWNREWLEQQIDLDVNNYHTKFFSEIKMKGYFKTDIFVEAFSKAKSYFIFKMLSQPKIGKNLAGFYEDDLFNFVELNFKEESHPLSSHHIHLSFLKEG